MYRSNVFKILSGVRDQATEEMKILTVSQSQGINRTLLALRHGNGVNKDYLELSGARHFHKFTVLMH